MEPLVTFIAVSHNEPVADRVFVNSMIMQTSQAYKAVMFNNGTNSMLELWLDDIQDLRWNEDNKGFIRYRQSMQDTGLYGCINRQTAIEECDTEYTIQTSVQDYWLPQTVQFINDTLAKHKPDILIWNSINHLVGPCQVLDAQLSLGKLDWGNFAIRTDIAKQIQIQGHEYCADWLFVKEALERKLVDPKKVLKLNALLTIHN